MMPARYVPVLVAITDSVDIKVVSKHLETAGLQCINELPDIRVITGEVSILKMEALKSVPGVVSVEEDRENRAI